MDEICQIDAKGSTLPNGNHRKSEESRNTVRSAPLLLAGREHENFWFEKKIAKEF